jgi:hypothetical protein
MSSLIFMMLIANIKQTTLYSSTKEDIDRKRREALARRQMSQQSQARR